MSNSKPLNSPRLQSLCINAMLNHLETAAKNLSQLRDSRSKKEVRKYWDSNLSKDLQKEMLATLPIKIIPATEILRIFDVIEPLSTLSETVNMIGTFRFLKLQKFNFYERYFVTRPPKRYVPYRYARGFDIGINNTLRSWTGQISTLQMNLADCEKLYNILRWSLDLSRNTNNLKSIAITTKEEVLGKSRLPSILARSHILTSVTILNGATNHVLRVLGLNCPLLKLLDVGHSRAVNDVGLRNLFLRNPRGRNDGRRTDCASSLNRLVLIATAVSYRGFEFASKSMEFGYTLFFGWDKNVVRSAQNTLKREGFEIDKEGTTLPQLGWPDHVSRAVTRIATQYLEQGSGDGQLPVLDIYEKEEVVALFLRNRTSSIVQSYMRVDGNEITKLVFLNSWSFPWNLQTMPQLTDLGLELPHLRVLKGYVCGTWDQGGSALFPKLEEAVIFTISGDTILAFLNHCPKIRKVEFNNFRGGWGLLPEHFQVDDASVREALTLNPSLKDSLEDLCIRPGSRLTPITVNFLTTECPNLKRLGDLQCWNVTAEDRLGFDESLKERNCRCVLTVMDFPPSTEMEDELDETRI